MNRNSAARTAVNGIHQNLGWGVVDGICLKTSNEADIVRNLRRVRQNFTQLHSALTILFEFEFRAQQSGIRIDKGSSVAFQKLSRRQLAITFGQFRLVVKHLQVTRRPAWNM